jgi:hypothetical protein
VVIVGIYRDNDQEGGRRRLKTRRVRVEDVEVLSPRSYRGLCCAHNVDEIYAREKLVGQHKGNVYIVQVH